MTRFDEKVLAGSRLIESEGREIGRRAGFGKHTAKRERFVVGLVDVEDRTMAAEFQVDRPRLFALDLISSVTIFSGSGLPL